MMKVIPGESVFSEDEEDLTTAAPVQPLITSKTEALAGKDSGEQPKPEPKHEPKRGKKMMKVIPGESVFSEDEEDLTTAAPVQPLITSNTEALAGKDSGEQPKPEP